MWRFSASSTETKVMMKPDINLIEYWKVLTQNRKMIGYLVSGVFVVSLIVSFLLPKTYISTAKILPPQQDGGMSSLVAAQLPGSLSGFAAGFLGLQSPADLWVGILGSQNVKDAVIKRFDLRAVYGTDTIEDTRKELGKNVRVEKSREEIISIRVEDEDRKRAADMANAFVEELDRVNRSSVTSNGKRMRIFVEQRLNEAKVEMAAIEKKMQEFQEQKKAVKLDDQSTALIKAIGTLKGELMAREVELTTLKSYASSTNPKVQILSTEIDAIKSELKGLTEGKRGKGTDFFVSASEIPSLAVQYARLLRDSKIQETLFELLTSQYEVARIQEARDTPTVQVLDPGKPAEKKFRPKRGLIVGLATFISIVFSVFAAFFREYMARMRELDAG